MSLPKPFVIGITGGTASGKTFVIEALKDYFNGKILKKKWGADEGHFWNLIDGKPSAEPTKVNILVDNQP